MTVFSNNSVEPRRVPVFAKGIGPGYPFPKSSWYLQACASIDYFKNIHDGQVFLKGPIVLFVPGVSTPIDPKVLVSSKTAYLFV